MAGLTPAIFLDRDGVLIENRANYVRSWADVAIYPQAEQALQRLAAMPFPVIVVTNQSVVGRGLLDAATTEALNTRILDQFRQAGGRIDAAYLCLHAPQDNCQCRKPRPGLLLQAAQDLPIDLTGSWMVGDALTDLAAGRSAGVPNLALLRTGRGNAQLALPSAAEQRPFEVYADLLAFVGQLSIA